MKQSSYNDLRDSLIQDLIDVSEEVIGLRKITPGYFKPIDRLEIILDACQRNKIRDILFNKN